MGIFLHAGREPAVYNGRGRSQKDRLLAGVILGTLDSDGFQTWHVPIVQYVSIHVHIDVDILHNQDCRIHNK